MDREEEIRQAATDYTKKQTAGILGIEKQIALCSFEAGAEWADSHPASPWHSVADGDFPKEDKDICIAVTEYGSIFIVYFVRHANGGIFYNYNEHTNIDIKYWMEIPQFPKESEVKK